MLVVDASGSGWHRRTDLRQQGVNGSTGPRLVQSALSVCGWIQMRYELLITMTYVVGGWISQEKLLITTLLCSSASYSVLWKVAKDALRMP